jgi:polyisoprenoid-binding protein YceI
MERLLLGLSLAASGLVGPAQAAERVVIDQKESRIEIEVKATIGSFVGHLAAYDAQIDFDQTTGTVNAVKLAFKFADVTTGEKKRDGHMHDWQETETFPEGRFAMTQLTPQAEGGYLARGLLTLHGKTQELAFPVNILTEGRTVAIDGKAVINTEQFGLPIIRKFLALKVDPEVAIQFHLQGTAPATE